MLRSARLSFSWCLSLLLLSAAACGGDEPAGDDGPNAPDANAVIPDASPAIDATIPPDSMPPGMAFDRHAVDSAADGPAYVAVGNLDADPALELVVSHFGKTGFPPTGKVVIYDRGATLDSWTGTTIDANVRFPGQPTLADVDGDTDLDIVLPSGFLVCAIASQPCGAIGWYEHTASGWTRHNVVSGSGPFWHHVVLVDVNGDARLDLVTTAETAAAGPGSSNSAVTQWFAGTDDANRFSATPRVIGQGGGSFPRVLDLDGDTDLDIASAEFFVTGGSFAWFERTAAPSEGTPAGTWERHVIHGDSGPSIMLTPVDDLYGDGIRRYLGANHTNTAKTPPDPWESAVFVFTPGADVEAAWTRTVISTGIVSRPGSMFSPQGAPGVFGFGDMDNDDDLDVVVSGDGDPRVLWLEQTSAGQFATRVLEAPLGQAGGMIVADLDGDGNNETIVTAYEENVVLVFSHD